ncbi:Uu.00g074240.m01.CDS01 [Anthostomella pinea]|uniref:Uu.00g074240.m01.CDS01 n=1 Tax=Anthostomella pinea TaxID=933095 RepID=A0AAI8VVG4_9PEZI|nr:Uu.00g074240.m01.CDS01 [Anthostomella pinea]
MVYYFTSNTVTPSAFVYVGKDKFENEELIKYGWEEDGMRFSPYLTYFSKSHLHPQFHVDKLSSAHIYLRLNENDTWDDIPADLVTDLAQLTKANSIEGNKKDNITVIYTPWSNLKKDGSMAAGQVSFKDQRKVKKVLVAQRENPIVNRLNKTRVERQPDLMQEKEDHLRILRKRDQAARQERKKEEARVMKERQEKKWQKDHAYDDLYDEEAMEAASNQNRPENWEEDFM